MARGRRHDVEETRRVIDEAETNRKRLSLVAARLSALVSDLRELTATLGQQDEGGTPDG